MDKGNEAAIASRVALNQKSTSVEMAIKLVSIVNVPATLKNVTIDWKRGTITDSSQTAVVNTKTRTVEWEVLPLRPDVHAIRSF